MNPIEYLLSIETRGIKMGINRTVELMQSCGNPQNTLPCIQVAGTNGKGSVCAILASIFKKAGYKTGLFTSPHLVNLNERIRINGTPISNKELNIFINKYKLQIETIKATFFETITTIACWYFNKEKVDIAIMETGLGGRLDSVTICNPLVTILTPISLDHIEILGNSLESIAYEKAGIFKKDVPCFSSKQDSAAKKILIKEATKKNVELNFINNINNKLKVNIPGKYQIQNANLAISVLSVLTKFNISKSVIKDALNTINWYGRNQIIKKKPYIIFDVAHNTAGFKSYIQFYNTLNIIGKSTLIIALQSRKNIASIIPALDSTFDTIICTETNGHNPMSIHVLKKLFNNNCINITNPEKAIKFALNQIKKNDSLTIIGSHCLAPSVSNVFNLSFDKC